MILHAGLLALNRGGRRLGVLVRGPSGSGKSDLAVRALGLGLRLVADDRTQVWLSGPPEGPARLYGRAPPVLAGLIEMRGIGVAQCGAVAFCRIDLIVDAAEGDEAVERLPQPRWETLLGVRIAALTLPLREASAPAKLVHALSRLGDAP